MLTRATAARNRLRTTGWWSLLAFETVLFAAVAVLPPLLFEGPQLPISTGIVAVSHPVSASTADAVSALVAFLVLGAPAIVAIAVRFDRRYVASVSDWEPRTEYLLTGILMWFGVGVPVALWYLYERHRHVGTP